MKDLRSRKEIKDRLTRKTKEFNYMNRSFDYNSDLAKIMEYAALKGLLRREINVLKWALKEK